MVVCAAAVASKNSAAPDQHVQCDSNYRRVWQRARQQLVQAEHQRLGRSYGYRRAAQ
jgi:hypothetical protein